MRSNAAARRSGGRSASSFTKSMAPSVENAPVPNVPMLAASARTTAVTRTLQVHANRLWASCTFGKTGPDTDADGLRWATTQPCDGTRARARSAWRRSLESGSPAARPGWTMRSSLLSRLPRWPGLRVPRRPPTGTYLQVTCGRPSCRVLAALSARPRTTPETTMLTPWLALPATSSSTLTPTSSGGRSGPARSSQGRHEVTTPPAALKDRSERRLLAARVAEHPCARRRRRRGPEPRHAGLGRRGGHRISTSRQGQRLAWNASTIELGIRPRSDTS